MGWIFAGFGFALGVWLFAIALRWAQRNPLTVVNLALIGLSVLALCVIALAWAYSWLAGLLALGLASAVWQGVMARKSPLFTVHAPEAPSAPSDSRS